MELRGEQALELRALRRALVAAAVAALVVAPAALAQTDSGPQAPVYDSDGNLVETPFVPQDDSAAPRARLTEEQATRAALADPKVRDWLDRYEGQELTDDAELDRDTGIWTVKVWAPGEAGQIALVKLEDATSEVTEAWTGPQVAWKMARGYDGAFGRRINDPAIWIGFCALFLLGLANWRKPLSLRNLDLLVLLSFSLSLYFFNRGEIFTAMPLAYPPLLYLLGRLVWIGWKGRGSPGRAVWPVWVLLAATVFAAGFRVGLNVRASNVIDVGYAGVIGAQRIVDQGEAPYGHMPDDEGRECGEPDSDGYVRERIQTNGRCESANARGDTYGPVSYEAYIPGYLAFGWTGRWDDLPAAHFTAILFDLLCLLGLGLVGRRLGGARLGATLAFAWAAYPFTQYVSSSNSNDAIMPAFLIWGFWLLTAAPARGAFLALGAWTKFAALLLLPLWAAYPRALGRRGGRSLGLFAAGFAAATLAAFSILLLEPSPLDAVGTFWDRTFGWQLDRPSPFSIWNWDEYPGYPDLHLLQSALKIALVIGALALAFVPRARTPLKLAALTGAVLIGFELVLTHWFYLYIPWFFPFVAVAVLAPLARRPEEPASEPPRDHEVRELVAAS
ncbi:MAG TPA: hypothetical protein VHK22_06250 [Gaiellaceae bacterium]|nr:hypothetical protein [Gaiellaceae bacterium]